LIERHLHYTGSTRAQEVLERWDDILPRFVKVLPNDFRDALKKMKMAGIRPRERAGESPREA
jgi:glutamate synthase (NADPH/NADH) large chain